MKLYNCPDCTHIADTCENCSRYQGNCRTNLEEYNSWLPYQKTRTFINIPPACRKCPNHPSNGGSGNCNCTLGDWPVIY